METLKSTCYVFQTDSEIVNRVYQEQDNFLIETNEKGDKEWCAIYFCSHDIYYPNIEEIFRKRIIQKNFFEWYHSRITKASKHIFIRDVFKQWYLAGINKNINTPEKLTDFLRKETLGYKIVTIGSSAGGYAAVLYGSLLSAEYVLAFNARFEIYSVLKNSTENINPLAFRLKDQRQKFFDLNPLINDTTKYFYFFSKKSQLDIIQKRHLKEKDNIYIIRFNTNHHGIPFLKVALPKVVNLNTNKIEKFTKKDHSPIGFTIQMVGLRRTISGLFKQIKQAYQKRR